MIDKALCLIYLLVILTCLMTVIFLLYSNIKKDSKIDELKHNNDMLKEHTEELEESLIRIHTLH